jgi:CBS domain-containing protein
MSFSTTGRTRTRSGEWTSSGSTVYEVRLCHLARLSKLTEVDIERALGVTPIETVSIHPERPLYEACRRMLESRARRIPLVDIDDETHRAMVVSVVTQYRILKFIAVNVKETQKLRTPLRDLPNVGTYTNLATANMDTPVMDVIHALVKKNISSVPLLDKDGMLLLRSTFSPSDSEQAL